MSTLTLKNDNEEFNSFPRFLKSYANHLAIIEGKGEKTICEYLLDLRTFFRYMIMIESDRILSIEELEKISIKHLTIEDVNRVDREMIVDFLAYARNDRRNNNTTRNRKLSALKSFFKHVHNKKHLISHNPVEDIEGIKANKPLSKFLTLEEAINLLNTVNADTESKTRVRDYSIISLFLNTGMRLSELCGLNVTSFDREITNVRVIGKGNKERVIYLNDAAREAVKSYMRMRLDPKYIHTSDKAFFLSGRQTRISPKTVQYIVNKYLEMSGMGAKGYSVHKLRHTAATLMYQSGQVDIRILKDILGHEQLNTTQIYTHLVSKNLEDAMYKNPLSDFVAKKDS
ncbi:MAG: tyrosine-type recombinase/integrase [Clostridia bacterium]|nr:tyrosine-type recombinase/integrase [Clostridia bacterium]